MEREGSGFENHVTRDTCQAIERGASQRFGHVEEQMARHSADIRELTRISVKLTTLLEGQAERISRLEDGASGRDKHKTFGQFWDGDTGRLLIKGILALIATLLAAAIAVRQ